MKTVCPRNAFLSKRLSLLVASGHSKDLIDFINSLSNAEFRSIGPMLADEILVRGCTISVFWQLFFDIVSMHPKAFLGTFLKAAAKRYAISDLQVHPCPEPLRKFAQQASAIDCKKILQSLLPIMREPAEVQDLLQLFGPEESEMTASLLIKFDTKATYYALFQEIRKADGNIDFLRDITLRLMHKGTQRSFRMAAIMQAYFGVNDLPGQLSLQLQPFELSLLEKSDKYFLKIIG